tara:strand:- start:2163 stop:2375 length:213 start_codon:yes stop_codon:yes gene_type:complete
MRVGLLVTIARNDYYHFNQNLLNKTGIIIKGPYESEYRKTAKYKEIILVYDVLIDGKIFEAIPREILTKA